MERYQSFYENDNSGAVRSGSGSYEGQGTPGRQLYHKPEHKKETDPMLRPSVLERLRRKQYELAAMSGKPVPAAMKEQKRK